jgi:hypothetical protein
MRFTASGLSVQKNGPLLRFRCDAFIRIPAQIERFAVNTGNVGLGGFFRIDYDISIERIRDSL